MTETPETPEQRPRTLRIVRGHLVTDQHGCRFGIMDVNPDLGDPAVALMVQTADRTDLPRPVCRPGRRFDCAAGRWEAVHVQTGEREYVDLRALDEAPAR